MAYLSKLQVGAALYDLKDNEARTLIAALDSDLIQEISDREEGDVQVLIDAKAYTDEQIGDLVLIKYEVVTTLPTADATHEFNKSKTIYLKLDSSAASPDVYDEFICINKGTAVAPVYDWERIGSTRIDLSNYYTKSETDALLDNKLTKIVVQSLPDITLKVHPVLRQSKDGNLYTNVHTFGTLADKDSASGSTSSQTVSASGSVTATGTVDVHLADNTVGSAITTTGNLTSGNVTVNKTAVSASKLKTAGSAASCSHTERYFAQSGITARVGTGADAETLILEVATTERASEITAFNGGAVPTFDTVEADKVTGASVTNTAVSTSGVYFKQHIESATFTGSETTVDIDDITIPGQSVTVS